MNGPEAEGYAAVRNKSDSGSAGPAWGTCGRLHTLRMGGNAYNDESGADQPGSYWHRRAVTLAAGLSLLGLLAWVFSGGGKPAPGNSRASGLPAAAHRSAPGLPSAKTGRTVPGATSPAASSSGAVPVPGGHCPPSAVVLSLFSRPGYPGRQDPQFEVYAVSTAPGTCTFDLGPGKLHLTVMTAGRVIWDSADCARSKATWVIRLHRGVPAQEPITWNRTVTLPGCVKLASSARPGTYEVQARTDAVASQVRTFKLR